MGVPSTMTDQELVHKLMETERALVAAKFRLSLSTLDDTSSLRGFRREIARLHTAARAREREQGLPKGRLVDLHRSSFVADTSGAAEPDAPRGGFLSGVVDRLTGKD